MVGRVLVVGASLFPGFSIKVLIAHTKSNKDVRKWIVHAGGDLGIGKWVISCRSVNVGVN